MAHGGKREDMLEFGMPTLMELPELEDCARLCNELGLRFVELNMCLPQYQIDKIDPERLNRIADKYGIYYTIHLDETISPCDFNPRVAAACLDTINDTILLSKRIGIKLLNTHLSLGTHFTLPEGKVLLFEKYHDEYLQNLTRFRDTCGANAGSDVRICIENTPTFTHRLGCETLDFLLESRTFAVTFDTGHDAVGNFEQRPVIDRRLDRLCHMHLHDALVRERRDHLPLGDGELDIDRYLDLAFERECRVVVEVKTVDGLRRSVEWLQRHGYIR